MEVEARSVRRAIRLENEGSAGHARWWGGKTAGGTRVVIATSGIGQAPAAAAANLLIETHGPHALVSFGVAGGLRGGFTLGEMALCSAVIGGSGQRIESSPGLMAIARSELESSGLPWQPAISLTVDRVVETPSAKLRLHEETGADVVEMESLAVGRVAQERGLEFLCLRSISDLDEQRLPDFSKFMHDNRIVPRRLAAHLARHPRQARPLLHFFQVTSRASKAFARLLPRIAESYAAGARP